MLRDIRKQYDFGTLNEADVLHHPFEQFKKWMHEAIEKEQPEPTAMVLSTVDEFMQPHSRVVLLKELTDEGFVFYTNYEGNKANQMAGNQQVSLLFFWHNVERQVRITGIVEKTDVESAREYFGSRPLDSQLGAWASAQSQIIENHDVLDLRFEEFKNKFGDYVPKPSHWGGYLMRPLTFEFWQGRPNRLHDRLHFSKDENETWKIVRLAP
ncbi:MAG TPA: pyridoxamine 5'-phosphate oxidase [Paludibacter sp.]|nr:pyridoxamine 5'-phosphate oxidase [Paludibacter sp.]